MEYWWDNGILEESGYYDNNIKYDEWTGNYISGNKKYIGSYIDGKQNGLWTFWHDDTLKKSEGTYKLGIKD